MNCQIMYTNVQNVITEIVISSGARFIKCLIFKNRTNEKLRKRELKKTFYRKRKLRNNSKIQTERPFRSKRMSGKIV